MICYQAVAGLRQMPVAKKPEPLSMAIKDRDARLLQQLREAATAGAPCPTNRSLADSYCASGNAETVGVRIKKFERDGLLKIETHAGTRRIRIGGKWTGWTFNPGARRRGERAA